MRAKRMAERDQLGGPFGSLDARDPRHLQRVAFRIVLQRPHGRAVHPHEGAERAGAHLGVRVAEERPRGLLVSNMPGVSRVAPAARRVDRRLPTVLGHLRRPRACEPWQATARWIR